MLVKKKIPLTKYIALINKYNNLQYLRLQIYYRKEILRCDDIFKQINLLNIKVWRSFENQPQEHMYNKVFFLNRLYIIFISSEHKFALIFRGLMMEIRTEKSSPVHVRIFGFNPCAILYIVMHLFPLVQEEIFIMFIMRNTSKLCILFKKELFQKLIITVVNLIFKLLDPILYQIFERF